MGHRAGDGRVGHTEHRLLKADADLNVHIGLSPGVIVVPTVQLVGKMPVHVLHAQARRNSCTHARDRIGVKSAVLEVADVG